MSVSPECMLPPDAMPLSAPGEHAEASKQNQSSPFPLHPHHGLCFSFFQGKGYSPEFTRNLNKILTFLKEEQPDVRMTFQPDPVCSSCPNLLEEAGTSMQNTSSCGQDIPEGICASAQKVLSYDRSVLSLCDLKEGDILSYEYFMQLVRERILEAGKRREICGDCQWDDLCR